MNELFSFCDDHFTLFILIWLKLREYYFEAKNKSISLPFIIKKTSNFLKNIRKQCTKIKRFRKISKFIYYLEIELSESERFIDKLQHLALIAEIFELPEPISAVIKNLGLDSEDNLENNVFSKKINDLFKNIDDIDLEKKVDIIENSVQQEGTLVNFLKNKNDPPSKSQSQKIASNPQPVYNPPIIRQTFRNTHISGIPRIGATPNPRTLYRLH
jgi:hypothetical protein